jgi:SWIM zinc finger
MATRHKPTFEQRVEEYIDSPLMVQRFRHEKYISAQIRGNFGVYRTTVDLEAKKAMGDCTCPSDLLPCKHVHALRATWDNRPDTFFDLDAWLAALPNEPKETLVEAIRNMILHSPNLLTVFGVPGFEEDEDDEADCYG